MNFSGDDDDDDDVDDVDDDDDVVWSKHWVTRKVSVSDGFVITTDLSSTYKFDETT